MPNGRPEDEGDTDSGAPMLPPEPDELGPAPEVMPAQNGSSLARRVFAK